MSEQQKDQKPKEECEKKGVCKKECCIKEFPGFQGFHGFGPRCHGFPQMYDHPHKHKERKCECGEVIPKRKEGEPKIKVCPKCGKDLPKKNHGFGMRCHKMKKMMRFWYMFNMFGRQQPFMGSCKFGPECWEQTSFFPCHPPCPPYHHERGLEVHHYIHFGPPSIEEHPPHFRPPTCFGPMGRPHSFGQFEPMGPWGESPCGPFGKQPCGPCGPCGLCEKGSFGKKPCNIDVCKMGKSCPKKLPSGECPCPCGPCKDNKCDECPCEKEEECERPFFPWGYWGRPQMRPFFGGSGFCENQHCCPEKFNKKKCDKKKEDDKNQEEDKKEEKP